MIRDFFSPDCKENDRPVITERDKLQEAMIYCTEMLPVIPNNRRYDLAFSIAAMADVYAFLDDMHNAYMKEYAANKIDAQE